MSVPKVRRFTLEAPLAAAICHRWTLTRVTCSRRVTASVRITGKPIGGSPGVFTSRRVALKS